MKKLIVKTSSKKNTDKSGKKNSDKYIICVGKNF